MWSYSGRDSWKLSLYTAIGSNCFIMQIATVPQDRRCFSTARGIEGARNKSSAGSCTSLLSLDSGEAEVEDREESRGTRAAISAPFSSQQPRCSDVVTNGAQALRYSRVSGPNRYLDNSIDSARGRSPQGHACPSRIARSKIYQIK